MANDAFVPLPRRLQKVRIVRRPPLRELSELTRLQQVARPRLGAGGRVFVRYSGTEPVVRVLVEGQDEAQVEAVMAEAVELLQEVLAQ